MRHLNYFHVASLVAAGGLSLSGGVGCGSGSDSDAFESNSQSDSAATEAGATTDAATGSGLDGTGQATSNPSGPSTAPADSTDGPSDSGDEGPALDVGSPTGGFGSCDCELIYLWVADHVEGTVSKINTRTLVEEGRYLTRADGNGNPSRTSVNLSGDVAVANRHGGLTKFFANTDHCVESNGMPGIQTSSGKDDVLPWEMEECRAWFTDFQTTNQRPVAWTGDTTEPGSCDATPADVWTVTSATENFIPGMGGPGGVIAYLVDGETGAIKETVPVPGFPGDAFGAYGGAVDGAGNLFFSPLGGFGPPLLARVERASLLPRIWDIPANVAPYGITVDHNGRVWVASVFGSLAGRFDPTDESWVTVEGIGGAGLAEGPDDLMYISQGNTVVPVHLEDLTKGQAWSNDDGVKGVSFDADGFLWAVTTYDDKDPNSIAGAYKIDVETMTTQDVYIGVEDPYTYSDMTGNALGSVACAPEG